jgi:ribosome modulation factor
MRSTDMSMTTVEQAMARHWGEKAANEVTPGEAGPECPYTRPDLMRAWHEGLRTAVEWFYGAYTPPAPAS